MYYAFRIIVAAALIAASFLSIRRAWADSEFRRHSPKAVDLAPGNTEYLLFRASATRLRWRRCDAAPRTRGRAESDELHAAHPAGPCGGDSGRHCLRRKMASRCSADRSSVRAALDACEFLFSPRKIPRVLDLASLRAPGLLRRSPPGVRSRLARQFRSAEMRAPSRTAMT